MWFSMDDPSVKRIAQKCYYSVNVDNSQQIIEQQDLTTFPVLHVYKNQELIKEIRRTKTQTIYETS